ncbi:MAG: hypothetical protein H0W40_14380 [Methylibium sp.]|uniref:hypothetical protein n=1 Tax=Methylibium sp. TaxID=2067992 RepID=UPI0017D5E922|nr:hypothetical protein [Methylibium sp.]MBA3598544.1 hypothetical protein [Methylibium sp.]
MKYAASIVVALTLVAAGCGEKEAEIPVVPAQSAPPPTGSMENVPKAPPPPADPAATSSSIELPKPGQNNDHSSPEFDKGGASAPKQ